MSNTNPTSGAVSPEDLDLWIERARVGHYPPKDAQVWLLESVKELNRRFDVLTRFAQVWVANGSDDEQLCMAHDFFTGFLNPPNLAAASGETT